jgi:hypothetical protein
MMMYAATSTIMRNPIEPATMPTSVVVGSPPPPLSSLSAVSVGLLLGIAEGKNLRTAWFSSLPSRTVGSSVGIVGVETVMSVVL